MYPPVLEELCPANVGEDLISLQLDQLTTAPRAFHPVIVDVDYSACDKVGGVVLPLELLIQAPNAVNVVRRVFRKTPPTSITFTPREGGLHGVLLRELGHNRWLGRLRVDVAGDMTARTARR